MEDTPVFDPQGRVAGWLTDDGDILDADNNYLGFLEDAFVFDADGRFRGEFSDLYFWDSQGDAVAFVEGADRGPVTPMTEVAPFSPVHGFIPIHPITEPVPTTAPHTLDWSELSFVDYFFTEYEL